MSATARGFLDWTKGAALTEWHVAETRLEHSVGGAVERACARSDLSALRRVLLSDWARFVTGKENLWARN